MKYIASLITWLGAILIPMLPAIFGSIVVQVLMMLGFSFLAVEGINIGLDFFVGFIDSSLAGVPSNILGVLGLAGADEAINIILTGHLFVLSLKGLTAKKFLPTWRGTTK
ncbi:DUF2523 domain-containing protein [Photobacterium chitinilyticum]|uniref:DUF2523 family protein n=1 Tax=Photobacterium chitinilyticum TaxID=2485123 RepID=UPI003D11E62B